MVEIRMAVVEDAETIAWHRVRMFADSGQADVAAMERMRVNFVDWVRPRLADGSYVGWMVEEGGEADPSAALRDDKEIAMRHDEKIGLRDDKHVVAGAGMWVMDFPPHWMDAEPRRAYLLNFYVAPSHRGQGLAETLLRDAVCYLGINPSAQTELNMLGAPILVTLNVNFIKPAHAIAVGRIIVDVGVDGR